VNEQLQQQAAVHYNGVNPRLQQSVTHFHLQMSDVLLEDKRSLSFVAAFCVHSVECFEGLCGLEEFDFFRLRKVNLIFLTEGEEGSYQCLR
jgi:hypothetical protein